MRHFFVPNDAVLSPYFQKTSQKDEHPAPLHAPAPPKFPLICSPTFFCVFLPDKDIKAMKKIDIHNFRCFKNMHVDLTPGINLFVGDNASGKTSLLMACKFAANSFFSGFSDIYTVWTVPRREDFHRISLGEKRMRAEPIDIQTVWGEEELPGSGLFRLNDKPQKLFIKEKSGRPLVSGMKELRDYGKWLSEHQISMDEEYSYRQSTPLPLIASFSTHGIHHSSKVRKNYFTEIGQTPSFGYYMCSSTDGLLEYWVHRLLVLTEAGFNPTERSIILKALLDMFGPEGCDVMRGFDVRVNYKDIVCLFNDKREIPTAILSDGYLRLFSIVIDLAFRCALLNSLIFGENAAAETRGTVLIDEIDLHLHPSLQAKVLKALQHTFPNIQFIVTTHAPMVMSGVETDGRNSVMKMAYDPDGENYTVTTADTYGMDLSTLASTVLDVPDREPSVARELAELLRHVDEEDYADARKLLAEMQRRYGNKIPELNGIETQINIEEELR